MKYSNFLVSVTGAGILFFFMVVSFALVEPWLGAVAFMGFIGWALLAVRDFKIE